MHRFSFLHYFRTTESRKFLFYFTWVSGILTGSILSVFLLPHLSSWMRSSPAAPVSIVGYMVVTLFPFLLSYIFHRLNKPFYILPIIYFKAFLYSFLYSLVFLSYGSAGWLVVILFYLPDIVLAILYSLFSAKTFLSNNISSLFLRSCVIAAVVICLINCCLIVPFCRTVFQ